MKKLLLFPAILLSLLALSACAFLPHAKNTGGAGQGDPTIQALPNMDDLDHWQDFIALKIEAREEDSSSREEVRQLLGEPDSKHDNIDTWIYDKNSITVLYREDTVNMAIMTSGPSEKTNDFADVKTGMSAREVIRKHGRPAGITLSADTTTLTWSGPGSKIYTVVFSEGIVASVDKH